jgi:hypothetical protein
VKLCIFCGRRANSGEHVWSDGLSPHLAPLWAAVHGDRSFTKMQGPSTDNREVVRWIGGPLFTLKMPCVCQNMCNGGWMSRLETRVQPLLISLIEGTCVQISADDARFLASWICLKTIITEQRFPNEAAYGGDDHRNFFLNGLPLKGMEIWIVPTTDMAAGVQLWRQTLPQVNRADGTKVLCRTMTFGLGRFLAFVEYNSAGGSNLMPLDGEPMPKLWPSTGDIVFDGPSISSEEVTILSSRYAPHLGREAPMRPTGRPT